MGHRERVLNYMLDYGGITSWEAIREFGITRLSAYIFNLRKRGYVIDNERITSVNRYGDKISYVRYNLDVEKSFNFETNKFPKGNYQEN